MAKNLLVDPFSVESIRHAICKVIKDADYREELVQNGLRNIERFRPERISAEYLESYKL